MKINMTNIKNAVLEVQGLQFRALVAGPEEGQLVLCLHGFPEFADAWRDVMRPIAQAGFYTVAVDQRGYSRKARPMEVRDYAVDPGVEGPPPLFLYAPAAAVRPKDLIAPASSSAISNTV